MKILKIEDCLPDYSEYDIYKCYGFSGSFFLGSTNFDRPKRIKVYCIGDSETFTNDENGYEQAKKWLVEHQRKALKRLGVELDDDTMASTKTETAKEVAFRVESRLAYNADDDKFTKKDIIAMMKEILKEYGI